MRSLKLQRGFSLIELLFAILIISVMSLISFAAFAGFGNTQTVKTASADVVSLLQSARSQALSQVKPAQCLNQPLEQYQVSFTVPGAAYALEVVCSGTTYVLQQKTLPPQLSFSAGSASRISFVVITGAAQPSGVVTISGYGKTGSITVNTAGNISLQ